MSNRVCFGKEIRWKSCNVDYSVKLIHKLGYNLVPCDQGKHPMVAGWKPYTEERLQRVILEDWLSKRWRDTPLWYVITGPTPYSDAVPLVAIDGDNQRACEKIEELCPETPLLTKSKKGIHYYYRYPAFEVRSRQKSEIIGDGHYDIDIRAWHGLIGCPGGPRYLWSEPWSRELLEHLPLYDPGWMPVAEKAKPEKRGEPIEITASLDERAAQFRNYLRAAGGCQVGETKSCGNKAFRLAMVGVHGMGVARDVAIEVMSEWGERHDQLDESGGWYPWTLDEVTHKIDSALSTEYQGRDGDKLDPTFRAEERVHQIVKPLDPVKVEQLPVQYDDPMEFGDEPAPAQRKTGRRRRAYTISELVALPTPEWQVKGMFSENLLVVLWGSAGQGKTFLALDWGLSISGGIDWLGRSVKCGAVLYIAAEGKAGIRKRCQRWLEYHQIAEPNNFWIVPDAFAFVEKSELDELCEIIDGLEQEPAMVIIDTLNRNIGGSESSEDDMGAFIAAADRLRSEYGSTVLVVHHTGWNNERERGHSSLRGAADTMISVAKLGDHITDGVEVSCVKQKEFDEFASFVIKCQQVGDGDDSSVVLTEVVDKREHHRKLEQEREDARLSEVLKYLSDKEDDLTTCEQWSKRAGRSRDYIDRIITLAMNAKCIVRVGTGTRGSPYAYYLSNEGRKMVLITEIKGVSK